MQIKQNSPMLSSFSLADNIIGFIVDGPYDDLAVERIQKQVKEKLETFDKLNLYIEDTVNADISLKAVVKSVPFKLKTGNRFEKVAVVTDRKWLQVVSNLEKLFFSAEIRIFSGEQRLEAIQWISH
ncbi:MAG TPA: STAS/SEC14 domain-containing protein [Aequorivita sp.]|nr:STAS/SEC14 domain-containing protein [Aequorivita sp.]